MTIQFKKIGKTFVAIAQGIDLRQPIQNEDIQAIEKGLATFGVVVFKNQPLDEQQQDTFIRRFGPGRNGTFKEIAGNNPNFIDVGTVDDLGNPIPPDSLRAEYLLANQLWHTDGSFNKRPIRITALLARELPPIPPPTEFADMRSAYQDLSKIQKEEFIKLKVVHSVLRSREQIGMSIEKFSTDTVNLLPPVEHSLVREHPYNKLNSLYIASHASHIVGWPLEKGRTLIKDLIDFSTQTKYTYSHDWDLHDFVMWDDRWTMHRATPYSGPHPRKMRQCAVFETEDIF